MAVAITATAWGQPVPDKTGDVKLAPPPKPADPSSLKVGPKSAETGKVALPAPTPERETSTQNPEVSGNTDLISGRVGATPLKEGKVMLILLKDENNQELLQKLLEATKGKLIIVTDDETLGKEIEANQGN